MINLNASKYEFYNIGEGLVLKDVNWDNLETNGNISKTNIEKNTNPNWLLEKAKKINRPKQALAPSKLIDDKTLQNTSNKPDGDAKEFGELLHKVLEILPKKPKSEWTQFLNNFFKNGKSKLTNKKRMPLNQKPLIY